MSTDVTADTSVITALKRMRMPQTQRNREFWLLLFAVVINLLMVAGIKIRMYVMAKVCNSILVTIRQEGGMLFFAAPDTMRSGELDAATLRYAKEHGFSDAQLAEIRGESRRASLTA